MTGPRNRSMLKGFCLVQTTRQQLALFWPSKFSWITFHVSSNLVCQVLSVAHYIETLTTNRSFLWYWSQWDIHLFYKFRMTSTHQKCKEGLPHFREFFSYLVRNELMLRTAHTHPGRPVKSCVEYPGLPSLSSWTCVPEPPHSGHTSVLRPAPLCPALLDPELG